MLVFLIICLLGIIGLFLNYKGNNSLISKISLIVDVISIFILLFSKQPYVIALMFVVFIIKIIMLINVNKSVIKKD
jgi:O-antigen/teichoic acid export membrane protein